MTLIQRKITEKKRATAKCFVFTTADKPQKSKTAQEL